MTYLCLCVAVMLLTATVICAWSLNSRSNKRQMMITPLNVMFAGVLMTAVLLFFPAYWAEQEGDAFQLLKALMLSVYSAVRLFAFDSDHDVIREMITGEIAPVYTAFVSVVMVAAPMLTFSFVLSFFNELVSYGRLLLGYFSPVFVFSELNDKSLALAADIRRENKHVRLVFTEVFEPSEDTGFEQQEQARNMGAMLFQKDILSVNFSVHSKNAPLYFLAVAENEDTNVRHGLGLVELYGNRQYTTLYVFSSRPESAVLLSSAKPETMRVRRVDEVRSLINRLLYDEGHLLFDSELPEVNGEKQITAVVVGMGKHGTAMVKSLSWFCQMYGYRVNIHGFDRDSLAEDTFVAQCPELMDPKYNGVTVPGEPRYCIKIHSDVDVNTYSFAKQIKELDKTSYVLVSLGDDDLNIRTAMNLRMLFEQCGAKPRIQAIVYNSEKCASLHNLRNFKDQPYNIDFIGDLEHFYTVKVILNSEVEREALRRHLRWGEEQSFWSFNEYNYNSSVALAIHARAKQKQNVPGANKTEMELTDEERQLLEQLEHRRWNAYMRSEGYIYSKSPKASSRNDLGKMHHDLVPYDDLSEEDKRKDSKVAAK